MNLNPRQKRVLRQHVHTDQLLGIDAVPSPPPPSEAANEAATAARGPWVESVSDSSSVSGDKGRQLDAIDVNEVRGCTKCSLCEGRTQTVFGDGDPNAELLFIGEGPGQQEDLQGKPFVGRAGELLNKMIAAMGLQRQEVYIANVVKCRPPENRTPLPNEVAACSDYLHRQIAIIRPKVIVTLGGPATKLMLDTSRGITSIRGTWHSFELLGPEPLTIPVMPTFHPAYLLRSYTKENRAKVWSDLLAVLDKLGRPRP